MGGRFRRLVLFLENIDNSVLVEGPVRATSEGGSFQCQRDILGSRVLK